MDRLRLALIVGAQRELRVAAQVGEALVGVRMVGQIFADQVVAVFVDRAEMLHERQHGVGIVAGARHEHQTVLVGLAFVFTRDLGHHPGLENAAELIDDRREQRGDAEQDVEDRRFVGGGHDVAPLDVPRLVADHAGEFVVGLREVDRPDIDVHVAAERRERVDVLDVENLDRVRDVLAGRLRPQLVRDVVDPVVEQRIGHHDGRVGDLLVVLFTDLNLGRRRQGKAGCRDAGTQHRDNERDDAGTTEEHNEHSSGRISVRFPGRPGRQGSTRPPVSPPLTRDF